MTEPLDLDADTAEACRSAVAALYTEESHQHADDADLSEYDNGVADAELAIAEIRDAARTRIAAAIAENVRLRAELADLRAQVEASTARARDAITEDATS